MEYRYPPIYKYLVLLIIIYLFLRYYREITPDMYLAIAVLITLGVILLDYMFVPDQPSLLVFSNKKNSDDTDDDEEQDNQPDEPVKKSKSRSKRQSKRRSPDDDEIKETRLPVNQYRRSQESAPDNDEVEYYSQYPYIRPLTQFTDIHTHDQYNCSAPAPSVQF